MASKLREMSQQYREDTARIEQTVRMTETEYDTLSEEVSGEEVSEEEIKNKEGREEKKEGFD